MVLGGLLLRRRLLMCWFLNLDGESHLRIDRKTLSSQHLRHRMETTIGAALSCTTWAWSVLLLLLLLRCLLLVLLEVLAMLGGLLYHLIKLLLSHLNYRELAHLRMTNYSGLREELLLDTRE